jgi:hypothetical protein
MKIISFGDTNYIPYVISGYRNLKLINKHNNFTIFCHEKEMVDKIKSIEPNCDAKYYSSKYDNITSNNEYVYTGLLQYKKIDILKDCVDEYKKVFYYDCDILIFDDFISDVEEMLKKHNLVFKLYRQLNRFNTDEIINIVNSGTVGINKSVDSDLMFEFFKNKALQFSSPTLNIEEYILTDFYNNHRNTNHCLISDKLNLVNCHDKIYTYEDIKTLQPKSFHPTYPKKVFESTKDLLTDPIFWKNVDVSKMYSKIEIARAFNRWFYE